MIFMTLSLADLRMFGQDQTGPKPKMRGLCKFEILQMEFDTPRRPSEDGAAIEQDLLGCCTICAIGPTLNCDIR